MAASQHPGTITCITNTRKPQGTTQTCGRWMEVMRQLQADSSEDIPEHSRGMKGKSVAECWHSSPPWVVSVGTRKSVEFDRILHEAICRPNNANVGCVLTGCIRPTSTTFPGHLPHSAVEAYPPPHLLTARNGSQVQGVPKLLHQTCLTVSAGCLSALVKETRWE